MTLVVLRNTSQLLCRTPLNVRLCVVFLMVKLLLQTFEDEYNTLVMLIWITLLTQGLPGFSTMVLLLSTFYFLEGSSQLQPTLKKAGGGLNSKYWQGQYVNKLFRTVPQERFISPPTFT